LFEVITNGRDWHEVVAVLLAIHSAYVIVFVVYIFFMVFLVLNVVVGGVVKTTSEVYKRDKQLIVGEEQERLKRYCEEIKGFFRQADLDGSGTLTWEEFHDYLHDDKVKAYFQTLELDISQAHVLFMLLDTDQNNEVAIDEFVDGCMRLKGQARSIDVNFLLYEIEKTLVHVEQFALSVEENIGKIEEHMRAQNPTMTRVVTKGSWMSRSASVATLMKARRSCCSAVAPMLTSGSYL
jgi:Ca2+-binding EF-hand superfamily protein